MHLVSLFSFKMSMCLEDLVRSSHVFQEWGITLGKRDKEKPATVSGIPSL